MNWFDNSPIDQIAEEDISAFVTNRTPEDQWLDFKGQPWAQSQPGTFELLHDVSALANAEGGYLFVGITTKKEQGRDIATGFRDVEESTKEAQRIRSLCQQSIDPPIIRLDVQPKTLQRTAGQTDLVGIHVPPSTRRPHAFRWRDASIFVSRYGTDVRFMPVQELGRQLSRIYFPETETNRRLGELTEEIQILRREIEQLKEASARPLGVADMDQLIKDIGERSRHMRDKPPAAEEAE